MAADGLDDARRRQPDRQVGRPLALDDLVGRVDHVVGDFGLGFLVEQQLSAGLEPGGRHTADRHTGPQRDLRVAVLADDEPVHVGDGQVRQLGDQIAEPAGVQHRSGAEDPSRRQVHRFHGGVGDDVDGVGDEHDHRPGRQLDQLRGEFLRHRDVGGREFQPRLARFLFGAGGHHDDLRVGGDGQVVAAVDRAVRHELRAVVEVEHLGPDLLGEDVVEGQGGGRTADQAGVGDRRSDAAHTDDGHLAGSIRFCRHPPILV